MSTKQTKKMKVPRPGTKARSLYDFLQRPSTRAGGGANFRECVHAYMRWETTRDGDYAEPFSCVTVTNLLKDFGHKMGPPGSRANWVFGPFPADGERVVTTGCALVAPAVVRREGLAGETIFVDWDGGGSQQVRAEELSPEWLIKRALTQAEFHALQRATSRKAANELANSARTIPDALAIHTTRGDAEEVDMLSPEYWQ